MRRFSFCLVFIALFLFFTQLPKDVFALVLDCANGQYMAGDCSGAFFQRNVDCAPFTNGNDCCAQLAQSYQQRGTDVTASCSSACQQPTTGDICSYSSTSGCLNSSCNGLPVFCCNYSNPPPPQPAPVVCSSNLDCVDGNPCTEDICTNPGTAQSSCTHTNSPAGKICDQNTGATCDGNGNCIPPVTPTPTCSSSNCGACSNCSTCINNASCGWNGSSCQAGTASCPAGSTQWYWDSCSTNACIPPPLTFQSNV